MTKSLLIGVCGLFLMATGEQPILRHEIYAAYLHGDRPRWEAGIAALAAENQRRQGQDATILYDLALAEYGLIAWCIGAQSCEEAELEKRLDRTEAYLARLATLPGGAARSYATQGALLAMRIGLAPAKALYLGPRSSSYLERAMKADPQEPAAWVEKANMYYHAPTWLGGDKKAAIRCFSEAVRLFDAQPAKRQDNWLYLHSLTWLGQAYADTGHLTEAQQTYQRLLAYEPDLSWVRDQLLPAVEAQLHR